MTGENSDHLFLCPEKINIEGKNTDSCLLYTSDAADDTPCVRKHAPIASQGSALPPRAGEADTKEERIYSFIKVLTIK